MWWTLLYLQFVVNIKTICMTVGLWHLCWYIWRGLSEDWETQKIQSDLSEQKCVLVLFCIKKKKKKFQRFPLIFSQLAVMSLVQKERAQQKKGSGSHISASSAFYTRPMALWNILSACLTSVYSCLSSKLSRFELHSTKVPLWSLNQWDKRWNKLMNI